jgi:hypothetical protein
MASAVLLPDSCGSITGYLEVHRELPCENLGTDRKFTSEHGVRSARFSKLPVRLQVLRQKRLRRLKNGLTSISPVHSFRFEFERRFYVFARFGLRIVVEARDPAIFASHAIFI